MNVNNFYCKRKVIQEKLFIFRISLNWKLCRSDECYFNTVDEHVYLFFSDRTKSRRL